jgi:WD40 repeat protein/serine/threonine protein kinase
MCPCPLPNELEDLIAGRLDAERHGVLDRHIESCAPCQAALEALDEPEDPFFAAVGKLAGLAVSCEIAPFRHEIDQLRSLPRAADLPFSSNGHDSLVDGTLGDFRIVRQVARGGMGVVYEAQQISLGRRVALKVLSFAGLLDPRRMQRFQNEVRAAASLEHPHIVPVYAVGSDRGVYYYAMRFIDGPNLADFIEQRRNCNASGLSASARAGETFTTPGSASTIRDAEPAANDAIDRPSRAAVPRNDQTPLAPEHIRRVVGLAIEAARALDYAHERGVIHRDIKPSNLMLDADGVLWIADFGLARIETDPTISATGEVMGTLRYMSPEQALGKRGVVDHRSDIYSLGVTIYELLTLTYVFGDVPDHVVLAKIASEDPPSPRWLNPAIPVDLETIVLKAMSKEPAERYATADEFASDLEAFREQKKIKAQRRGLADRFARWLRRHPAGLGVAATAVIALVALAAGFATYSALLRRTVHERDESNVRLEVANRETASALRESKQAEERADRALQESRQQVYAQDIEHAARAIAGEDVSLASNLLARHVPQIGRSDLRGFEWYWLRNRLHGTGRTFHVSQKPVYDAEYSPDGLRLATGGADGVLSVFDIKNGERILRVPTGQIEINAVAFTPDGKTIATTGDDATIRLWDALNGAPQLCITGKKGKHAFSVLFTPDGRQLVTTGNEPVIRIWNAKTAAFEGGLKDSSDDVNQIAMAADGKTLASASDDGAARLWHLPTRKCLRVFKANEGSCLAVALSRDAKLLVAGYGDRTVRIWKCSDGKTALAGRLRDPLQDVCFLPTAEGVLAADRAGTLRMWAVPQEFDPPPIHYLAAVTSIFDGRSDGSLARWKRHAGIIHHLAVGGAGNTVASAGNDGTVSLTELQPVVEGPEAHQHHTWLASQFCFGPHDELLWTDRATLGEGYTRGGDGWLWNLETGSEENWGKAYAEGIACIAITPDGKEVLLGHEHGKMTNRRRHSSISGQGWDFHGSGDLEQLDFAPDGRTLIVRMQYGSDNVRLYDYPTGRRIDRPPSGVRGTANTFARHGNWLVTNGDRMGSVWDLRSPAGPAHTFGYTGIIRALAVSSDERLFASGNEERKIILRRIPTGTVEKELLGHEAIVSSLAFSPDGRTLISGDVAGAIKVWNVQSGRFLFDFTHRERKIERIEFSPSGRYLAYSAFHGPLVVFDLHRLHSED